MIQPRLGLRRFPWPPARNCNGGALFSRCQFQEHRERGTAVLMELLGETRLDISSQPIDFSFVHPFSLDIKFTGPSLDPGVYYFQASTCGEKLYIVRLFLRDSSRSPAVWDRSSLSIGVYFDNATLLCWRRSAGRPRRDGSVRNIESSVYDGTGSRDTLLFVAVTMSFDGNRARV